MNALPSDEDKSLKQYSTEIYLLVMPTKFNFFKTSMPETRKADIYLGCLDGSVFVDFGVSDDNFVVLVRISFDGYGCCNLDDTAVAFSAMDSQEFMKEIGKEKLHQETICRLVKKIVHMNKDRIWKEALEEYGLLK